MGKTTTIRSIIGFSSPRLGVIKFKGKEITGLPAHQIAQMGLGLVPQGRRIFPSLSVRVNLVITVRTGGKGEACTLEKVYSLFPILKERTSHGGLSLVAGSSRCCPLGGL